MSTISQDEDEDKRKQDIALIFNVLHKTHGWKHAQNPQDPWHCAVRKLAKKWIGEETDITISDFVDFVRFYETYRIVLPNPVMPPRRIWPAKRIKEEDPPVTICTLHGL